MTPEIKAKELVYKFSNEVLIDNDESKRCSLIAVDEILNVIDGFDLDKTYNYYLKVKEEIQKL